MMLVPTYLDQSPIHGTGLYAAEPIAKGTKIWQHMPGLDIVIDPSLLSSYPPVVQQYLKRYCYPHPTEKGMWEMEGDHGRFLNHSETPNLDFAHPLTGYARTDIAKGTELTCNYHEFMPGFVFV